MNRWNEWGDDTIVYELPEPAREYLGQIPGSLQPDGGTISHHHGLGTEIVPFLLVEKDIPVIDSILPIGKNFDADGMMNPGKFFAG